ncbi:flagellar assembly peptidoglycan hydrolase FlgJ [Agaribacterium sp. ZY112]|uniref:flagellar assembly peptidoglycan hydrolase FlgJ n=1 Tax=Agaribacterium sp. ZY112 TaxID=3233574 RepID=UPI003524CA64
MSNNTLGHSSAALAVNDVYTDLSGLQQLKHDADKEEALKKVAKQFESLFVSMLMKSMRQANDVFAEGSMFDSNESRFYRDMYDQQLSLSLSSGRGIGIADALYRQLSPQSSNKALNLDPLGDRNKNFSNAITFNTGPSLESTESAISKDLQFEQKRSLDTVLLDTGSEHKSQSPELSFISKFEQLARNTAEKLGLDVDMLLAQAALETGWGEKIIRGLEGQSTHNLFNIKADKHWSGDSVSKATLEFFGGVSKKINEPFRSYSSASQSFEDYQRLITESPRYQKAVALTDNARDYIKELHNAGYATDPHYSSKVLSVYDRIKSLRSAVSDVSISGLPSQLGLDESGQRRSRGGGL